MSLYLEGSRHVIFYATIYLNYFAVWFFSILTKTSTYFTCYFLPEISLVKFGELNFFSWNRVYGIIFNITRLKSQQFALQRNIPPITGHTVLPVMYAYHRRSPKRMFYKIRLKEYYNFLHQLTKKSTKCLLVLVRKPK